MKKRSASRNGATRQAEHPALIAYRDLVQRIIDNPNDASWMPSGTGDIVGRSRLESELIKRKIPFPSNPIDELNWWENIGGCRLAKRLSKQFRAERCATGQANKTTPQT